MHWVTYQTLPQIICFVSWLFDLIFLGHSFRDAWKKWVRMRWINGYKRRLKIMSEDYFYRTQIRFIRYILKIFSKIQLNISRGKFRRDANSTLIDLQLFQLLRCSLRALRCVDMFRILTISLVPLFDRDTNENKSVWNTQLESSASHTKTEESTSLSKVNFSFISGNKFNFRKYFTSIWHLWSISWETELEKELRLTLWTLHGDFMGKVYLWHR